MTRANIQKLLHRLLNICATVVLAAATIISYRLPADQITLVPYAEITVPLVYGVSAFACALLIFRLENVILETAVLIAQSFLTVWTGKEILGIFLYSAMIIMLLCNKFFRTRGTIKTAAFIVLWLVILPGIIPYGRARTIIAYIVSILQILFYAYIYVSLKDLLVPLLPPQFHSAQDKLPAQGSVLHVSQLQELGLSERQIQFILDSIKGKSYAEIAEMHAASTSTVKKEMVSVFKAFGVKTREELLFILLQYTIKE
ncbi:MAG: hypothetical protein J6I73_07475 [Treponema sp.]|nr:hypothetical protein [Treponema sp.]